MVENKEKNTFKLTQPKSFQIMLSVPTGGSESITRIRVKIRWRATTLRFRIVKMVERILGGVRGRGEGHRFVKWNITTIYDLSRTSALEYVAVAVNEVAIFIVLDRGRSRLFALWTWRRRWRGVSFIQGWFE